MRLGGRETTIARVWCRRRDDGGVGGGHESVAYIKGTRAFDTDLYVYLHFTDTFPSTMVYFRHIYYYSVLPLKQASTSHYTPRAVKVDTFSSHSQHSQPPLHCARSGCKSHSALCATPHEQNERSLKARTHRESLGIHDPSHFPGGKLLKPRGTRR